MNQISITVPDDLRDWVETRIAFGKYVDAGDYLRDLMRRDQETSDGETEWLREQVAEGMASGVVEGDARDILREIMAEHPASRD